MNKPFREELDELVQLSKSLGYLEDQGTSDWEVDDYRGKVNTSHDALVERVAEKDKQIEELREGLKESFKHLEEITWWEACPDDMKEEISKLINDSDLLSKETK